MPAREEYRKMAQAILAQAEVMREPGDRAVMLGIARLYFRLADRVGRATTHRAIGEQPPENDSLATERQACGAPMAASGRALEGTFGHV